MNASNTGYTAYFDPALGRLLTAGDLTSGSGGTFSTPGQVIEKRRFTSSITITADNITLRGCLFDMQGSATAAAITVSASAHNFKVEYCTIQVPAGSIYFGVLINGSGVTVQYSNISHCENNISVYADAATIQYNYLHDSSNVSHPSGHRDEIEVYNGDNHVIRNNRIMHDAAETTLINIAPWGSGDSISGVTITDNFLDGGNTHIMIDNQAAGVTKVRVLRNLMGGHTATFVGRYVALLNCENRAFVETEAALTSSPTRILWPTSGGDENRWSDCSDLTPNRTGQVIVPTANQIIAGGCIAPTTP